jgi:hypothetical protein
MFDSYQTGYVYNQPVDSEMNRLLIKNIVLDGNNENCGVDFQSTSFPRNGSSVLFISGSVGAAGRLNWTAEKIKVRRAAGAGIANYASANLRLWNYHSENNFKSFLLMSGSNATSYVYDITVWGDDVCGGLHMEGYEGVLSIYGANWTVNGPRNWICVPKYGGVAQLDNITVTKITRDLGGHEPSWVWSVYGSNSSYPTGQITVTNSSFYVPGSNHRINTGGPMNFTNCTFVSFFHPSMTADECGAVPYSNAGELGDTQLTFTNCTFSNDGTRASGYPVAGVAYTGGVSGSYNWDSYPNAFLKFDGCTFNAALDGAWLNRYGGSGHLTYILRIVRLRSRIMGIGIPL